MLDCKFVILRYYFTFILMFDCMFCYIEVLLYIYIDA